MPFDADNPVFRIPPSWQRDTDRREQEAKERQQRGEAPRGRVVEMVEATGGLPPDAAAATPAPVVAPNELEARRVLLQGGSVAGAQLDVSKRHAERLLAARREELGPIDREIAAQVRGNLVQQSRDEIARRDMEAARLAPPQPTGFAAVFDVKWQEVLRQRESQRARGRLPEADPLGAKEYAIEAKERLAEQLKAELAATKAVNDHRGRVADARARVRQVEADHAAALAAEAAAVRAGDDATSQPGSVKLQLEAAQRAVAILEADLAPLGAKLAAAALATKQAEADMAAAEAVAGVAALIASARRSVGMLLEDLGPAIRRAIAAGASRRDLDRVREQIARELAGVLPEECITAIDRHRR